MGGRHSVVMTAKQLYALRHNLHRPRTELTGRFVVFSQSRSGSSLLADLLDTHPKIDCHNEIYQQSPPLPHAYRHAMEHLSDAEVFGFKLQVHHLDNEMGLNDRQSEEFIQRLVEEGYRFIYLKRGNSLRQVVSDLLRDAGGPTYKRADDTPTVTRLSIDVGAAMQRLEVRRHYWQVAEELLELTEHLDLLYERDLQGNAAKQPAMDRAFDFLELESVPVETELRRINSKPLSELIENYDELSAALRGTQWEPQLQEGR